MPPISVLIKPASGNCNMYCEYCFYCDEINKRAIQSYGFMSEQTIKNIIRKTMLKAEGSISYVFQGGEPTLCGLSFFENVIKYQKQYNKNGISVHNALQTNGFYIEKSWCEFFKKHNFLLGVSVDGTERIHNIYRHSKQGEKSYKQIEENIKMLELVGVEFNILTVVHNLVAINIKEIYQHYKKMNWMYQQYILCLDPLNEEHGKTKYAISPQQYGEFLITLFDLWYKDWKKGKQPFIRQFINYVNILMGYPPEACDQRGCCGIQNVVEADGSVYPCDFYVLDEYNLGNFNENNIEHINKQREFLGFIEKSKKLNMECYQCKYYYICRGGCQRNRDFNRDTQNYDNYFCLSYRMFFDACLDKMREIGEYELGAEK